MGVNTFFREIHYWGVKGPNFLGQYLTHLPSSLTTASATCLPGPAPNPEQKRQPQRPLTGPVLRPWQFLRWL